MAGCGAGAILTLTALFLLGHGLQAKMASHRNTCLYDSDCVEGAYCEHHSYCSCKDGNLALLQGTVVRCLPQAKHLGDACSEDAQCQVPFGSHALCSPEGRCGCETGTHFEEGRCYETALVGEKCKVSNNCVITSEDVDAYCYHSVCTCPWSYHPSSDGTNCLKDIYLGEPCVSGSECLIANTRCVDKCRCKVNFLPSEDRTRCLRYADKLGQACEDNGQCTEFLRGATCDEGFCRCARGYHNVSDTGCAKDVGLGEQCQEDSDCVVLSGMAVCANTECQCAKGYVQTNSTRDCESAGSSIFSCSGCRHIAAQCSVYQQPFEMWTYEEECIVIEFYQERPSSRAVSHHTSLQIGTGYACT